MSTPVLDTPRLLDAVPPEPAGLWHDESRDGASATAPAADALRTRRGVGIEFLRYFVASGGALAVDVGLFQLALHLSLGYRLAAVIGFCAGAASAYAASVLWVFDQRTVRNAAIEFMLFVAIGAAGLLLTEALLWVGIERLGMSPLISKIGAAGGVFVFNFTVRKALLFRTTATTATT